MVLLLLFKDVFVDVANKYNKIYPGFVLIHTLVTQRQPPQQRTTNATKINKQS